MSDDRVQAQLKVVSKHLEDIAESLRIISGRQEKVDRITNKKPSYVEEYFAKSHIINKPEQND